VCAIDKSDKVVAQSLEGITPKLLSAQAVFGRKAFFLKTRPFVGAFFGTTLIFANPLDNFPAFIGYCSDFICDQLLKMEKQVYAATDKRILTHTRIFR
jgi:hypothetical protein